MLLRDFNKTCWQDKYLKRVSTSVLGNNNYTKQYLMNGYNYFRHEFKCPRHSSSALDSASALDTVQVH